MPAEERERFLRQYEEQLACEAVQAGEPAKQEDNKP